MHFDISLDDFDLRSRSQLYEKSKTSVSIFLEILQSIWIEFSMYLQSVGLLEIMHKLFCPTNIQGRELSWSDYKIYVLHCPVLWLLWIDLFQTLYDAKYD